jgi:hypothetical protein
VLAIAPEPILPQRVMPLAIRAGLFSVVLGLTPRTVDGSMDIASSRIEFVEPAASVTLTYLHDVRTRVELRARGMERAPTTAPARSRPVHVQLLSVHLSRRPPPWGLLWTRAVGPTDKRRELQTR